VPLFSRSHSRSLSRALDQAGARARALGAVLRDVFAGAAGTDAYRNYLTHHRAHHLGQRPLTRESFFRQELAARWEGVRRCC
jgi:uncharacterized short protein YbdD (DUF466 family)